MMKFPGRKDHNKVYILPNIIKKHEDPPACAGVCAKLPKNKPVLSGANAKELPKEIIIV